MSSDRIDARSSGGRPVYSCERPRLPACRANVPGRLDTAPDIAAFSVGIAVALDTGKVVMRLDIEGRKFIRRADAGAQQQGW